MGFPDRLLSPGEEIILDLRPALLTVTGPLLLALAVLVGGGYLEVVLPGLAGFTGEVGAGVRLAVALAAILILLVGVLPRLVRWRTTRLVLTGERVLLRNGFLVRRARQIPLERINDISCAQSVWERLVGLGDLMFESAGDFGQERFPGARHPDAVQLAVYQQIEAIAAARAGYRLGSDPEPAAPGSPATPGVLDQIERLAMLRDRGVVSGEEFEAKKQDLLRRL